MCHPCSSRDLFAGTSPVDVSPSSPMPWPNAMARLWEPPWRRRELAGGSQPAGDGNLPCSYTASLAFRHQGGSHRLLRWVITATAAPTT